MLRLLEGHETKKLAKVAETCLPVYWIRGAEPTISLLNRARARTDPPQNDFLVDEESIDLAEYTVDADTH